MHGILGYTEDDVVSTDFVGDARYMVFYKCTKCLYIHVNLLALNE